MIVKLQKAETLPDDSARAPRRSSTAEPTMIAEHANIPPQCPADDSGRRLRSRLILANFLAWVAIIVVIRLVFF
ncbi:hypothetical protein ASC80_20085 [Afipia sp. Root123D2]|uniref:hypothetical protein n=1 Tax=Afipia sp. Root123D2 TaxID=1736436 RepID=UPI0006FCC944|nr:hypothetical protein [Afipia sp. Root123D2]KQW18338.1 hypothetical protein ASC80_20085 [Afipia sp. Root123D2]